MKTHIKRLNVLKGRKLIYTNFRIILKRRDEIVISESTVINSLYIQKKKKLFE